MTQHDPVSPQTLAHWQTPQRGMLARLFDGVQSALPSWLGEGAEQADAWVLAAERLGHAVQALEQAGRPAPAQLVRVMERAVARVAAQPELRTMDNASLIQQASVALRSYVDHTRGACPEDARALFPVYQPVAALARMGRCEPADLWRWHPFPWKPVSATLLPAVETGDLYDSALRVLREQEPAVLLALADVAGAQASVAGDGSLTTCWQLLAAVLQLRAAGALEWDRVLQRAVSGMVAQHTRARRGQPADEAQLQSLAQDMLFLLAQGVPLLPEGEQPLARALADAYGVLPQPPVVVRVDTAEARALLAQAVQGLPEETVKTLGELRWPLELYNAYLQSADAWSRELVQQLNRWARQPAHPVPQSALVLSAQLARASAQLGLDELATLGHAIERALVALQVRMARGEEAELLHQAAGVLGHELHQVAVDFVRPVPPSLLEQLAALAQKPHSDRVVLPLPDPALGIGAATGEAEALPEQKQGEEWQAYLKDSLKQVQQLQAVLKQWEARPENAGASSECLRLLQGLQQASREAGAASVLPLVQAALSERALLRVRDASAPDRLQALQQAVLGLEAGLREELVQAGHLAG
ncbi:hypothetical protein [Brachymonas denitrificans]|uniref:hypothetical protein n=1 Tax=Brachymonas denitrificans TaxID=28220 RepID=UPI002AFEB643|nr:hypothetical protein [Brachymonas denitrificans]